MHQATTLSEKLYTARKLLMRGGSPVTRFRQFRKFRNEIKNGAGAQNWEIRGRIVCEAVDNAKIPRAERAGEVVDGALIMHNGLGVLPDSYCGADMTNLLRENKGVHEPQEELAFAEVLSRLRERGNGRHAMLELGSYWAFYSLWFHTALAGPSCYCVEPEAANLELGKQNFHFNGLNADFIQAFVGAEPREGTPPTISVDSLMRDKKLDHIDILHSDIQGYELEMLLGARETFARNLVDYVFVSTHGHFVHYRCIATLKNAGFRILADADMIETVSAEGVIVAGRLGMQRIDPIHITPRIYSM